MRTLIIILLTILAIAIFVVYRVNTVSTDMTNKAIKNSIGTYQIDLDNSSISDYFKDSLLFKSLNLQLKEDMTFAFSKSVPFIYDSCGPGSLLKTASTL
jgi:uncharacterized protein YxeA